MTKKDAIHLTPKQKEVILAMREKEHILGWDQLYAKFYYNGKTFRYDLANGLQNMNLIEKNPLSKPRSSYSFTLPPLGRTIQL